MIVILIGIGVIIDSNFTSKDNLQVASMEQVGKKTVVTYEPVNIQEKGTASKRERQESDNE